MWMWVGRGGELLLSGGLWMGRGHEGDGEAVIYICWDASTEEDKS